MVKKYTCPMHAEVISDQPGSCPKCGMDLVPQDKTQEDEKQSEQKHKAKMAVCSCC